MSDGEQNGHSLGSTGSETDAELDHDHEEDEELDEDDEEAGCRVAMELRGEVVIAADENADMVGLTWEAEEKEADERMEAEPVVDEEEEVMQEVEEDTMIVDVEAVGDEETLSMIHMQVDEEEVRGLHEVDALATGSSFADYNQIIGDLLPNFEGGGVGVTVASESLVLENIVERLQMEMVDVLANGDCQFLAIARGMKEAFPDVVSVQNITVSSLRKGVSEWLRTHVYNNPEYTCVVGHNMQSAAH